MHCQIEPLYLDQHEAQAQHGEHAKRHAQCQALPTRLLCPADGRASLELQIAGIRVGDRDVFVVLVDGGQRHRTHVVGARESAGQCCHSQVFRAPSGRGSPLMDSHPCKAQAHKRTTAAWGACQTKQQPRLQAATIDRSAQRTQA